MSENRSIPSGVVVAIAMWVEMLICWMLDRLVIQNFVLGLISLGLAPLILFIWYVVQCTKNDLNNKFVLPFPARMHLPLQAAG